jgi:hypothetical protein
MNGCAFFYLKKMFEVTALFFAKTWLFSRKYEYYKLAIFGKYSLRDRMFEDTLVISRKHYYIFRENISSFRNTLQIFLWNFCNNKEFLIENARKYAFFLLSCYDMYCISKGDAVAQLYNLYRKLSLPIVFWHILQKWDRNITLICWPP